MLRIGVLGAARIAPRGIVAPANSTKVAESFAIAARHQHRAAAFAARFAIPKVHRSYAELVADPMLDAVYIALPNSLHYEWTLRALEAGKHVLCEKPIASNAVEATEMATKAASSGLILMEAFHYRYHPLALRMREIVESGVIGAVRRIETFICSIIRKRNDIRYQYYLAGGAMMDLGCYAVHMARFLANAEPSVTGARAALLLPYIDRCMQVELLFPDGVTGRATCSSLSRTLLRVQAMVYGDQGELRVTNPMLPQFGHLLQLRTARGRRWEHVPGMATYTHQLLAFVESVRTGKPPITDGWDAVANMRVIDAAYAAAGLPIRGQECGGSSAAR